MAPLVFVGMIFAMKNIIRIASITFLFVVTAVVYGAVPPISVTVSDPSGKVAYKGTTSVNGSFATGNLKPGNYIVQFNSKNMGAKGAQFALVISAGKKKVTASAVPGEKFIAGGVAMKIDVGNGLNIAGQLATETKAAMKNGKKMVYVPPQIGSHMPGKWVEEGSAEAIAAQNAGQFRTEDVHSLQERTTAGSHGN